MCSFNFGSVKVDLSIWSDSDTIDKLSESRISYFSYVSNSLLVTIKVPKQQLIKLTSANYKSKKKVLYSYMKL